MSRYMRDLSKLLETASEVHLDRRMTVCTKQTMMHPSYACPIFPSDLCNVSMVKCRQLVNFFILIGVIFCSTTIRALRCASFKENSNFEAASHLQWICKGRYGSWNFANSILFQNHDKPLSYLRGA